jgi:para-nitrobenzyl esterase
MNETQNYANNSGVRAGIIVDGYAVTKQYDVALKAHDFANVPMILNANSDDSDRARSYFRNVKTVADYKAAAASSFGNDAAQFLALYPASTDAEAVKQAAAAWQDSGNQGANRNCAQLLGQYGSKPVYLDMFDHKHPFTPGVVYKDINPKTAGALHVFDIPYWFSSYPAFNVVRHTRDFQPRDKELGQEMTASMIQFAATGNPSTADMTWKAWSPSNDAMLVINDKAAMRNYNTKGMAFLASHPAKPAPQNDATPGANRVGG